MTEKANLLNKLISSIYAGLRLIAVALVWVLAFTLSGTAVSETTDIHPLCYTANYALHYKGLRVGNSTHRITKLKDNHYLAESISKPLLKFLPFADTERSEFLILDKQVQPLQYQFHTQDHRGGKSGVLNFDWKNQRVKATLQNVENTLPLPLKAQDKLSHFFQLRKDLSQNQTKLEYIIMANKTKTYHFKILGEQTLRTSIGTFKTLVLEHVSEDSKRVTQLWLAKDLDYLMVKLTQIRKGTPEMIATIQSLKL